MFQLFPVSSPHNLYEHDILFVRLGGVSVMFLFQTLNFPYREFLPQFSSHQNDGLPYFL